MTAPVFSHRALGNLTPADRRRFERFGQGPRVDVPHACIHHAFELWARTFPHVVAAEHLGQQLTYRQLDRQANRLATHLAALGVSTGDNVALFVDRGIPMLVGILATLKAGAAYVPQDVGIAPPEQLQHVLRVASTRVILTLSSLRDTMSIPHGHVCIAIDEMMRHLPDDESTFLLPFRPSLDVGSSHRCYILFTSGSFGTTGQPIGVQITHDNVCNLLLTAPGSLGMRPGLKVGQILDIASDMAAWETLGCLSHGATLVIRGTDLQAVAERVDVLIATPSILGLIDVDRCRNVKTVAVAGEPCPRPLADRWAAHCDFYNACGSSETTIVNTVQHYIAGTSLLTIGRPTPNNTVYVLDDTMAPCPIGEIGEMWAGGAGVSAGYLNDDALNAERYAPDRFLGRGSTMFRTGDLGRWTRDGELEHLGRVDDQVDIRGFRIKMNAVSVAMEAEPSCRQAITSKRDGRDLVGFVRPASVEVDVASKLQRC